MGSWDDGGREVTLLPCGREFVNMSLCHAEVGKHVSDLISCADIKSYCRAFHGVPGLPHGWHGIFCCFPGQYQGAGKALVQLGWEAVPTWHASLTGSDSSLISVPAPGPPAL